MSDTPATLKPRRAPLWKVERELSRQMKLLQGPDERPVQRARMANLVIYCNSQEQAARLNAEIPEVVAVHPARVLLLVADDASTSTELTATVLVRPQRIGAHALGFSEQVTLEAGKDAVDRLPFAVRALLIGDLPTNLWWAAPVPPPLAGPLLYELGEHAQQIVYDSLGWPDPARGVDATATWLEQAERSPSPYPLPQGGEGRVRGNWRVASDINWRRLKYWRRMLTQALEGGEERGVLETVSEIRAEHGPHAVVQAWELISWLTRQLGWTVRTGKVESGVEMIWHFHGPTGEPVVRIHRLDQGAPEIQNIRITCKLDGRDAVLNLFVQDNQRLAMQLEGVAESPRTMSVPPHSPAELTGRQLSDRERDPVFRKSMAVAQVMARSLLG
jgi:glucose-6-phosphate dehydrogenase assembly protein OpcA